MCAVAARWARSSSVQTQGLVGRFNEVLVEFATNKLETLPIRTTRIWAVGDRMLALMADTGLIQPSLLPVPTSVNAITSFVGQILIEIEAARERGEVTEIYLFHNHPRSGTFYEPVGQRLLPLDHTWQSKIAALPWPTKSLPEVIGGVTPAIAAFIRGYLFVLLFQACAESLASKNASRLAAMQRAEKNIEDILGDLTLRNLQHLLCSFELGAELVTVPAKVLEEWANTGMPLPDESFQYEPVGSEIPYEQLDLDQPWEHFNIEHDLTKKGIQKFVSDYESTIRKAS